MKYAVLLLVFLASAKDLCDQFKCPPPERIETFGCSAQMVREGQWKGFYHVRGWTRDRDGNQWNVLIGVREPLETRKALDDCGDFVKAVQKRLLGKEKKR